MPELTYPCRAFLIEQRISRHVPAVAKPVNVVLSYSSTDPLVVTLRPEGATERSIARQQLFAGLVKAACTVAVSVIPKFGIFVEVTLLFAVHAPTVLSFHRADIETFLSTAFELVPLGDEAEHLELDAELARLVAGERP